MGEEHRLALLVGERGPHRAVDVGVVGRSSLGRAVHNEYRVAGFDEPLGPARPTVRRIEPFRALGRPAMNEYQGVTASGMLGRFPGHEHGPVLEMLAVDAHLLAGQPEVAAPGGPDAPLLPELGPLRHCVLQSRLDQAALDRYRRTSR